MFCPVFVRIGAARCVYFVSDGGRHGASAVGVMAQGDSVGYVSIPCRLSGRLVAFLEFCSQFVRISAA